MRQFFETVSSSFKMAIQELWKNKLRAFLSLFGVTIGIFCVIGVLATVNSLEYNIQTQLKSLGTNTIYIDKWDITALAKSDYPYWKYRNRPSPRYEEAKEIKKRTNTVQNTAFVISIIGDVETRGSVLNGAIIYGITEELPSIQPIEIAQGRFFSEADFAHASNVLIMGNDVAEELFGSPERALGKTVQVQHKKVVVVGLMKKQGSQMQVGWRFDKSVLLAYPFARTIMDERKADPLIWVKGYENINSKVLSDELTGVMRAIRKLSPAEEDNFALNDVNDLTSMMSQAFVSINIGGWSIAILSLVVGMFGVANIMFVTVKERTSQIGLKKAIGAKSNVILTEFLLESAFLCLIGGLIGLILVFIMTKVVTNLFDFPIFISTFNMIVAIGICIIVGILAGIVPASQAARMNPVTAIRS